MLTGFVGGTSMTFSKNPNYWGYDQRHPQNRVPYADTLKVVVIPDASTAMAALRTGKIDIMGGMNGLDWRQAQSVGQTNPEILQGKLPAGSLGLTLRCDKAPFTDIRVRKALQMAIDLKTIAKTYYGGTVDWKPCGMLSSVVKGYAFAYDDWPEALKEEYSYNPIAAKQLLAEAGYPNGFKTDCVVASNQDLQLLQIMKSELMDIGVDMEIREMDWATWHAFATAGKHDQMVFYGTGAQAWPPTRVIGSFLSTETATSFSFVNDPGYDAIVAKFWAATDPAELKRLFLEADRYSLEKHWNAKTPETFTYNVSQPYVKGYSGESLFWGQGLMMARFWVDQDLKKSMGR